MSHILLTGFMGTGKSTVGPLLAARLGLPFIDLDVEIEVAAGVDIPTIFAKQGQPTFRRWELRMLKRAVKGPPSVIALGGGAITVPELRALARRSGPLVCLTAEAETIVARVTPDQSRRPLLDCPDPAGAVETLLDRRREIYGCADVQVDTTGRTPEAVADAVVTALRTVHVNLGERSYDIRIVQGQKSKVKSQKSKVKRTELGEFVSTMTPTPTSAFIITSPVIDGYYGAGVRAALTGAGVRHDTLLVPPGERMKSLRTANHLYGELITRRADRRSVIIALGGGVIGDLAGFVAATYLRGVRFVQIPTTLLAMVDSAVGGKVGVNHPLGKNMIGAFLQPQAVFADPATLATLPRREVRTGLAEVVKTAAIADADFFGFLEDHATALLRLDPWALAHIVRRCCAIKAWVVEQDEMEASLRAILNFGHTAAHAVETATGYRRYRHGEAVAMGMVVAARIAVAQGMLPTIDATRLEALLLRLRLPTALPPLPADELMRLMTADKKAVGGDVRFVLPTGIGAVQTGVVVPPEVVRGALVECGAR